MTTVHPSRFLIYGLVDPRDRCLRYIGKTHKRREIRLQEHVDAARAGEKSYVYNWIRRLLESNQLPEIFVIERVPGTDSWEEAERSQIKFWREPAGIKFPYTHPAQTRKSVPTILNMVNLTNIHKGGIIRDAEQAHSSNVILLPLNHLDDP
jgi:hypothetical protein